MHIDTHKHRRLAMNRSKNMNRSTSRGGSKSMCRIVITRERRRRSRLQSKGHRLSGRRTALTYGVCL